MLSLLHVAPRTTYHNAIDGVMGNAILSSYHFDGNFFSQLLASGGIT